jgi:O-methyltransferase
MIKKLKSITGSARYILSSMWKLLQNDYIAIERAHVWGLPNLPVNDGVFQKFCDIAAPVIGSRRTLLDGNRLYIIFQSIKTVLRSVEEYHLHKELLPVVEVGVYRGGSSFFIASAFKELLGQEVPMYSIDTFAGHPSLITKYDRYHTAGRFGDTDYVDVSAYLSRFTKLTVIKADIIELLLSKGNEDSLNLPYGFAHIDVDIYQPTLDCLKYFGEHLTDGGIIVVDDYEAEKCPGVKQAVSEYTSQHPEYTVARPRVGFIQTEQIILVKKVLTNCKR